MASLCAEMDTLVDTPTRVMSTARHPAKKPRCIYSINSDRLLGGVFSLTPGEKKCAPCAPWDKNYTALLVTRQIEITPRSTVSFVYNRRREPCPSRRCRVGKVKPWPEQVGVGGRTTRGSGRAHCRTVVINTCNI